MRNWIKLNNVFNVSILTNKQHNIKVTGHRSHHQMCCGTVAMGKVSVGTLDEVGICYGTCQRVLMKKLGIMSQTNLRPGSWQLSTSSSLATSALNFVSSLPMMKLCCPESSTVMISGFTVTNLRRSNSLPGEKPHVIKAKNARQVKSNVNSMIITFFDFKGIVHKEFAPLGQNVNSGFCGDFPATEWKLAKTSNQTLTRTDLAPSTSQRPVSHFRLNPPVSGEKQNGSHPSHTVFPIWHPVASSYCQKWNFSWKDTGLITLRRHRPNGGECLTLS